MLLNHHAITNLKLHWTESWIVLLNVQIDLKRSLKTSHILGQEAFEGRKPLILKHRMPFLKRPFLAKVLALDVIKFIKIVTMNLVTLFCVTLGLTMLTKAPQLL